MPVPSWTPSWRRPRLPGLSTSSLARSTRPTRTRFASTACLASSGPKRPRRTNWSCGMSTKVRSKSSIQSPPKNSRPSRKTTADGRRSSTMRSASLPSQGITVLAARSAKVSAGRVSTESSLERTCVNLAKKNGCLLLKLTGYVGIPDRVLLTPGGKVHFVELKRPGKPLRKIQAWWQSELKSMRFQASKVDTVEQFLGLLTTTSSERASISLTTQGQPSSWTRDWVKHPLRLRR